MSFKIYFSLELHIITYNNYFTQNNENIVAGCQQMVTSRYKKVVIIFHIFSKLLHIN